MDNAAAAEVGSITPRDFKDRLDRGEPFAVLDVREDHERAYAAIGLPEASVDLFIPMNQIPARLGEITAARDGGFLVVYCHHGQRSMVVAEWLARQGVEHLYNLEGGIDAWSRRIDPAVRRY